MDAPTQTAAPPRDVGLGRLRQRSLVVMADAFPVLPESFVVNELRAMAALGRRARVVAASRTAGPADSELEVDYLPDQGHGRRLACLAWLLTRHPRGCLEDLRARRRWAADGEDVWSLHALAPLARALARAPETHLHVHFASAAAMNAMRLARLLGLSFSVTAHAYDIFQSPRNLREKLRAADLVTSGCDYNVDYLRELVGPDRAERVHKVVMGVDGMRFARRVPCPARGRLLAVGRLVEKKGFGDLIEALAQLPHPEALGGLRVVGDGPLRGELEAQIVRLGLTEKVELVGWREPEQVRDELERADLLVMPCVVARDGDRDSMPVVVKEALAMELPVIGTDEVGLPELIDPRWGRLVPPADPRALAAAVGELLALPPAERARMGAAGRAHVLEHCEVHRETGRLLELIDRFTA